ncbi:MAG: glycoside hydrolase family 127 protein [Pirellulaceae bacterium]|jgi:DUF1680 family protein|nr:glycoside hydrolase family 127 protein [Pirellulaceae bacterium]
MNRFPHTAALSGICLLSCIATEAAAEHRWQLPEARDVQLGGAMGEAYRRGAERLSQDPYRSAAFLRSDVSFETKRVFVNYSGDISGRFIEIASLMSPPGRMTPETLPAVLEDFARYQQADGHFGRAVDWNSPLEPENPNAVLLPIFWGNSRLLVGLLEAHRAFGRPDLLAAAKRIGDFYIATADRFLDPAREAEYRSTGTYAAGYVTDYFPGIEGLVRLYQATRDERYLRQAERMAAFFHRFDALPIDHSHGNLITHYGLLLLYEATGKAEYLDRPRRRWDEAVQGGYVWPTGGVGEKFRVSYPVDEGCSEADWLRLNLQLWRLTGESRYLEMAERLLWNHYATNRAPNGGYGHHEFACDADGPLVVKPKFTEAVWCCTFHGLRGLHTLKSHVVVGSDRGLFINFPLDVTAPISAGDGVWQVAVTCQERGGSVTCAVQVESRDSERRVPDVFLRPPAWAESVTVTDHRGEPLESAAEGGYLRLPGAEATQGGVRVTFAFSPRLEDRRLKRLALEPAAVTRHPGVTLWDGPRILLANTEQARPALIALVGKDGRLQLPRDGDGNLRLAMAPRVDAAEQEIAAAVKSEANVVLSAWERVRKDAAAAFVFDLITVPETSPLADAFKP